MTDVTHDPEADAVYLTLGKGTVAETEEIGQNILIDRDAEGRILGIEILAASSSIAPGDWSAARAPGPSVSFRRPDAAE